ncbi:hypothetical protein CCH79_00017887 [Gambusia affinis]|uniref:Uncharacterized protein n=1 Tax=Gambusia affinis TaxID=33528 RepID=A0A315UZC1_GAMAF|nr:hypothetical protein CCH79_00017887 [Gambusia affinis]
MSLQVAVRRSFVALQDQRAAWRSVLEECDPLMESLGNLGEQMKALSRVRVSDTPLRAFPDLQERLQFQLLQAVDLLLQRLRDRMSRLQSIRDSVGGHVSAALQLYQDSADGLDVAVATQRSSVAPSIADMLEWLQDGERFVSSPERWCRFLQRKTLLLTLRRDDRVQLEGAAEAWRSLDSPDAEQQITDWPSSWSPSDPTSDPLLDQNRLLSEPAELIGPRKRHGFRSKLREEELLFLLFLLFLLLLLLFLLFLLLLFLFLLLHVLLHRQAVGDDGLRRLRRRRVGETPADVPSAVAAAALHQRAGAAQDGAADHQDDGGGPAQKSCTTVLAVQETGMRTHSPVRMKRTPPASAMPALARRSSPAQVVHFMPQQDTVQDSQPKKMARHMRARAAWMSGGSASMES